MSGQIFIRVKPLAVNSFENILAVCRSGRPVHKLLRTIGTFIELVDTPFLGKVSADGGELVRGHIPCERNDDTHSRILRCVTVGGI